MSELQTERSKGKGIFTKERIIVGVSAIILICIFYAVGQSSARVDLEGVKVNHDELVSAIASKHDELEELENNVAEAESKLNDVEGKLKEKETEYNEALKVIENKASAQKDLDDTNGRLNTRKSELKELDSQVKAKENELAALDTEIIKAAGEPKTLMSGQYLIGVDVPEGRYQVTNIGRGTNFFVYDDSGYAVVNTILGDGEIGSGDYVFFGMEGQVIETHGKVKLIPVE
ncbi:hypothetical protein [Metabacillus sp. Hm71]|uniref:hypothetical protein n=1 Tax=Metabacillus sp. Hm71 TaxID=3450743 RepID=UPI003F439A85